MKEKMLNKLLQFNSRTIGHPETLYQELFLTVNVQNRYHTVLAKTKSPDLQLQIHITFIYSLVTMDTHVHSYILPRVTFMLDVFIQVGLKSKLKIPVFEPGTFENIGTGTLPDFLFFQEFKPELLSIFRGMEKKSREDG